jgi:hypothetical protein
MPDTKISALAPASALAGGEAVPAVQGGATVRLTPEQILTYALAQPAMREAIGGAVALTHPGYVSGLSYCPPFTVTPAPMTVSADTLYAVPIPITQACMIASIGLRVTTGASGSARVGLYADDHGPGAKVAEGASAPSTGSAASIEVALTEPVALAPGIYWLAIHANAPVALQANAATERGLTWLVGATGPYGSINNVIGGVTANAAAPFSAGLPSVFGAWSPAGRVPLLSVTIA